ncbi:hypothetical protein Nmel_015387 [Mimus melanotis]
MEAAAAGRGSCGMSLCGNETTGMSAAFWQTPRAGVPVLPLRPPDWHWAPQGRHEPVPQCWSRRGKSTANSPQIPLFHHQSPHPSAPRWAEATEDPQPTASRQGSVLPHPASPNPQGPARSAAPSGTLSKPLAPRASPGPSPDPSPSRQGSPVLMNAVGSRLQDSRGWHGGPRAAPAPAPAGRRGHRPPAPPAGRGTEGARKSGCGFQSPRGKDVTPRVGPPRAGGLRAPLGEGGRVWAAPQKGASCPAGSPQLGPTEQLRAGARVAPKAEVRRTWCQGCHPPRARCRHGQGALRYLNTEKRLSTRGGGG